MATPAVSVIMPVYNAHLYACRCYSVLLWYWRLQGEKSGA